MHLIERVQYGGLWVPAHPSCAHFMNRKARRVIVNEWLDVARAGGGQHLGSGDRHILPQRNFVFSPGAMNLQHRNAISVNFFFVEFYIIVVIWQALPIAKESELPGSRLAQRLLKLRAEAGLCDAPLPTLLISSSLKAVSPYELGLPGLDVPKSGNIDSVGPPSDHRPVLIAGDCAPCSTGFNMVHQVVTQLSA